MNEALIQRLADAFKARGKQLYLVGGSVRDLLLGSEPKDLDFATDARPADIRAIAEDTHPTGLAAMGEKLGTIHLVYGADEVEITAYRAAETFAPDSGHLDERFGHTIEEDLSRRDFTINAIAKSVQTGEVIDPYDGQQDIRAAIIRAVGSPYARFMEDPLRLLRAVRFAAQLGFGIDDETNETLAAQAHTLQTVSSERIRDEFARILTVPGAVRGIQILFAQHLLAQFLPEVVALAGVDQPPYHRLDVYQHTLAVVELTPPRLTVRLAALLHDIAKPVTKTMDGDVAHFYRHEEVGARMTRTILRRLRFGNAVVEHVARVVDMHMRANAYTNRWSDGSVRRLFVAAGDTLDDLLDLAVADGISDRDELADAVRARIASLRARIERLREEAAVHPLVSPLSGEELMALFGRPPGPWIKPVKEHLHNLVLDGQLQADNKEQAIEAAHAFLAAADWHGYLRRLL
jgi:poly(A) polymerase